MQTLGYRRLGTEKGYVRPASWGGAGDGGSGGEEATPGDSPPPPGHAAGHGFVASTACWGGTHTRPAGDAALHPTPPPHLEAACICTPYLRRHAGRRLLSRLGCPHVATCKLDVCWGRSFCPAYKNQPSSSRGGSTLLLLTKRGLSRRRSFTVATKKKPLFLPAPLDRLLAVAPQHLRRRSRVLLCF